jgi:hypothetical protein
MGLNGMSEQMKDGSIQAHMQNKGSFNENWSALLYEDDKETKLAVGFAKRVMNEWIYDTLRFIYPNTISYR